MSSIGFRNRRGGGLDFLQNNNIASSTDRYDMWEKARQKGQKRSDERRTSTVDYSKYFGDSTVDQNIDVDNTLQMLVTTISSALAQVLETTIQLHLQIKETTILLKALKWQRMRMH